MSTYGDIEDAIAAQLGLATDEVGEGETPSPFKVVRVGFGGVGRKALMTELGRLATANTAPAAIVGYAGGVTNKGEAGDLHERAEIQIGIICPHVDRAEAIGQAYDVLDYVRATLHNRVISGLLNPLLWVGTDSPFDELPPSTAGYVMRFEAPCHYEDGDG